MCQIAKISKSSYYNWLNKKYSEQELEIMEMVKQIYWANNGELGYRRITMELRRKFNLLVNHKKVLRIMQDFGLKSKIRKTKNMQQLNEKMRIGQLLKTFLNLILR